jgi:hypothetical protein
MDSCLVVGPSRSGTSAVTRAIILMGVPTCVEHDVLPTCVEHDVLPADDGKLGLEGTAPLPHLAVLEVGDAEHANGGARTATPRRGGTIAAAPQRPPPD